MAHLRALLFFIRQPKFTCWIIKASWLCTTGRFFIWRTVPTWAICKFVDHVAVPEVVDDPELWDMLEQADAELSLRLRAMRHNQLKEPS